MGFLEGADWGKIAKTAIPVATGALFGGSGQSKQASQSVNMLGDAQRRGFALSDLAVNQAEPYANMAQQYIPQGAKYFQSLLSGRPGAMDAATAGERDVISQNFQSARNGIMAAPRGGGRTSALAQLPTQQAAANSRLLYNLRPQAATQLMGAGVQAGGLMSGLLQNAVSGVYGSNNASNSLLNYDLQRAAASREGNEQLGSSIFDLINAFPIGRGKVTPNPDLTKVDTSAGSIFANPDWGSNGNMSGIMDPRIFMSPEERAAYDRNILNNGNIWMN